MFVSPLPASCNHCTLLPRFNRQNFLPEKEPKAVPCQRLLWAPCAPGCSFGKPTPYSQAHSNSHPRGTHVLGMFGNSPKSKQKRKRGSSTRRPPWPHVLKARNAMPTASKIDHNPTLPVPNKIRSKLSISLSKLQPSRPCGAASRPRPRLRIPWDP